MNLAKIIEALEKKELLVAVTGNRDIEVSTLTYDSRKVVSGTLFLCKGRQFKKIFLEQALDAGAVAYMASEDYEIDSEATQIIVSDVRSALAVVANTFYESPWEKLNLIGITGTKGKSTTVCLLDSIFRVQAEKGLAPMPGLCCSLRIRDGIIDEAATLTTPENIDLYEYLNHAVHSGLKDMIVEVSSQALKYKRVGEIHFSHGVFLNISPDHIGPIEHQDFDDYFKSKLTLFEQSDCLYFNADMAYIEKVRNVAKETGKPFYTFGLNDGADYQAKEIASTPSGLAFTVVAPQFREAFHLPMKGRFNVENALAAIAIAYESGVPTEVIRQGLEQAVVPGRMHFVPATAERPAIIVDYAHNKVSFEKVLEMARGDFPKGRCWVVFGAPGEKAQSRRLELGAMASRYADEILITADDPAGESVENIAKEIVKGFEKKVSYQIIPKREEAVAYAVKKAEPEDVVLLLGKGAERYQKGVGPYAGDLPIAMAVLEEEHRK